MNKLKTMLYVAAASAGLSTSAHAATSTFYNCALNTGCQPVNVFSLSRSDYAKTKHPIVLAHGALATNTAAGLNFWYGIPESLAKNGAQVYSAKQSSFNSSLVRSEQLYIQVQQILAVTGAQKLNLIGHSHGGPSIRYVAHHMPNRVASVTSVGSPHKGSKVADLVDLLEKDVLNSRFNFVYDLIDGLGRVIDFLSGGTGKGDIYKTNARASLASLTTAGSAKFNAQYPEAIPTTECGEGDYIVNGVRYYSWSGVAGVTNILDAGDMLLAPLAATFKGEPNDALVSACSSHLGKVLRDNYRMNHVDEINHLFGLVNIFETNPVAVYRKNANLLKNEGL